MLGNLYLNGNLTLRLEFESRSKKLAAILQTQGISQGDTVAILMRNDVKYLEVIQACRYIGSYFVPLNWHSVATEIEHIIEDSGAKVLIAHKDLAHQLNEKNLPNHRRKKKSFNFVVNLFLKIIYMKFEGLNC